MSNFNRKPDFKQMLKVLDRQIPDRDVLFELFMNMDVYERAIGKFAFSNWMDLNRALCQSYAALGYDYATVTGSSFSFPESDDFERAMTYSLNDTTMISDRKSFDEYPWPDAKDSDYSMLKDIEADMPAGMKLAVMGPAGVLEAVIKLVGYDTLCLMLYDDEALLADIFEQVGIQLLEYYRISAAYDSVGMLISNDDWGFNQQTMFSPEMMRKYLFPWHKEIVKIGHAAGKPVMLHSCGNFSQILDDLYDMGFDARHSYEDNIMPVEEAYELLSDKMAVLGGIDMDFLCRASHEEIKERSRKMLARGREKGGYALGSGNSIPVYCPVDNYLAMLSVVDED